MTKKEMFREIQNMKNPYGKKFRTIKDDTELIKLLPNEKERTAICWYLMGEGWETCKTQLQTLIIMDETSA